MNRHVDHLPLIFQSPRDSAAESDAPEDEIGRNSVIPWIRATRRRWKKAHERARIDLSLVVMFFNAISRIGSDLRPLFRRRWMAKVAAQRTNIH
jgi:hypothetical protein